MLKKIIVAIVLTLMVLAFPLRLFNLPEKLELAAKFVKGIIFIALIFSLIKRDGLLQRGILFKRITAKTAISLSPVIILIFCYLAYSITKNPNEIYLSYDYILLTLAASFVAATGEEVVFRGYIFNVLNKTNYSLLRNIFITSLIFAFTHMINIFRHGDVWSVINQIVFALALGMLFGSIYTLTRNLFAVSILHFFVNVPSALSSARQLTESEGLITDSSLLDNIISLIFMTGLMFPFIMLAMYYIKLSNRQNTILHKESLTFVKGSTKVASETAEHL